MLINCTNAIDPGDSFVINPPAVLPKGTRMSYHDRNYVVEEILYDDDNGCIDYIVAPDYSRGTKGMDSQVIKLYESGQKLQAVKFVKETMNVGLKEAKDYVDALAAKLRL